MSNKVKTNEDYLTAEEQQTLLRIARDAITAWVMHRETLDVNSYLLTPALKENHGAFVTLRIHGELRGCIGFTHNRESLVRAVRDNAINAASCDPRFPPVSPEELGDIAIEISALTPGETPESPFIRVRDPDDIKVGRDGLFIEIPPFRGGLLLPQVAVEHGWSSQEFLSAVCRKAGYPDRTWENPRANLYRFSAQVFSEPTKVA